VKTEDSQRQLLAYELEALEATPARRRRSRPIVGTVVAAALLLLVGIVIGALARNRAVDHQRRRAAGAAHQISSLRHQVEQQQATIADQQRQIARSEERQASLRRSIAQQRRVRRSPRGANTSFNDGLYQVGVAIQPGRYHTDGSDSCYWAKLSTGDTNRVIVNNFGAGPQTVTIDSPYFESEGCGTWTRVA